MISYAKGYLTTGFLALILVRFQPGRMLGRLFDYDSRPHNAMTNPADLGTLNIKLAGFRRFKPARNDSAWYGILL